MISVTYTVKVVSLVKYEHDAKEKNISRNKHATSSMDDVQMCGFADVRTCLPEGRFANVVGGARPI